MNEALIKKINDLCAEELDVVVKLRESLHSEPEIGYKEFKTAEKIQALLKEVGIPYTPNVAETGTTGMIEGKEEGPVILLRADIDGLPMDDESSTPYTSTIKGMAHTCGHDGNTAALVGALRVINRLKDELPGKVKFAFTPAEEGGMGVVPTIESGIMENPKVEACFAQHVNAFYPAGTIAVRYGALMAGALKFDITFSSKAGTRTDPETATDALFLASQWMNTAYTVLQKSITPFDPTVLQFTNMEGGSMNKTYPGKCILSGHVKIWDVTLKEKIEDHFKKSLESLISLYGGSYEAEFSSKYPPLQNDWDVVNISERAMVQSFGRDNIIRRKNPLLGGEDFSFMADMVPSAYFLVGVVDGDVASFPTHHHPKFDFDSKHLIYGMRSLVTSAVAYLLEKSEK